MRQIKITDELETYEVTDETCAKVKALIEADKKKVFEEVAVASFRVGVRPDCVGMCYPILLGGPTNNDDPELSIKHGTLGLVNAKDLIVALQSAIDFVEGSKKLCV